MIAMYCLIEDSLPQRRLRQRGPQPTLRDSELLTMEVVGEFLGLDTESNIFAHFCRYYTDWFPGLRKIKRTTFTRQAANLWKVKQELWQMLAQQIEQDRSISIVDSFPVPAYRFARAPRCCSLKEWLPLVMMKSLARPILGCAHMYVWRGRGSLWSVPWRPQIFTTPRLQKNSCRVSTALLWQIETAGNPN